MGVVRGSIPRESILFAFCFSSPTIYNIVLTPLFWSLKHNNLLLYSLIIKLHRPGERRVPDNTIAANGPEPYQSQSRWTKPHIQPIACEQATCRKLGVVS